MGVVYLIRRKDWGSLVLFSLMPVCIVLLLSKYQIVLGRNLSLVLPFSFLFMTYGLMEAEAFLEKWMTGRRESSEKKRGEGTKQSVSAAGVITVFTIVLVLVNGIIVCNNYRYGLSYTRASAYIEENIPAGSRIYCTSYMPLLDAEKYEIMDIGEDISLLPDELGEDEYFINVEYATGYFFQKKDYLFFKGGDMYPDKKAAYEQKTANYNVMESWQGLSYGGEWKYRIGYFDVFLRSPAEYSVGPTIIIYQ